MGGGESGDRQELAGRVERVGIGRRWEGERVGIERRSSEVAGGEIWDRQEWGTRGGVWWEGERVGRDRWRGGVGWGEIRDRQEEWGGRGRD